MPQVFRLADGRHAVVKFQGNPQGTRAIVNDFICCRLARVLGVPLNEAVFVQVDDRLLREPKASGVCPSEFHAGIHCGLIRHDKATKDGPASDVLAAADNAPKLHDIVVFNELVARDDVIQLLTYPTEIRGRGGRPVRRFVAYDYGFAFGEAPEWSVESLSGLSGARLPTRDAIGNSYLDGGPQRAVIDALRGLTKPRIEAIALEPGLSGWGVTMEEATCLIDTLERRARDLVQQYDILFNPQIEAPL